MENPVPVINWLLKYCCYLFGILVHEISILKSMKFPFMSIYEDIIRNNVYILEELVVIADRGSWYTDALVEAIKLLEDGDISSHLSFGCLIPIWI
jgi:hypothetical protein